MSEGARNNVESLDFGISLESSQKPNSRRERRSSWSPTKRRSKRPPRDKTKLEDGMVTHEQKYFSLSTVL